MNKMIPLLPAQNVKETAEFYETIGWEITDLVMRPYPYAVVKFGDLELNFYSSKKLDPNANDRMNFMLVDDVDAVYEQFTTNYKLKTNKVPRSGKPMFSKPRDLKDDRRFSMSDPNGNYFYIGTPITENIYRTITSDKYAENFKLAYDLLYSKLDLKATRKMIKKHFPLDLTTLELSDIDLAKVLLLEFDLRIQSKLVVNPLNERLLLDLFSNHPENSEWKKLKLRFEEISNT